MKAISDNRDNIVMAALDLAKAHTRWKTGKGSLKSFSKAKNKYIEILGYELTEVYGIGTEYGWKDAFTTLRKAGEKMGNNEV